MPAALDPACIFAALEEHEVDYVLIGGLAAVIHGSPAMTNDADICPASDADNVAHLAEALRDLEARLRVEADPAGVPVAALAHIIRSKEAADRPRDRAVLPLLYALRDETGELE